MDLSLLQTLKEKLLQAKEFGEVFGYFMDHFGEDPAFIALGERTEHPFLIAVIRQVAGQVFGGQAQVAAHTLTRLPEHQFVHGGFTVGGRLGTVIYFDDVQVGLVALVTSFPSGRMHYARFTGKREPPN